MAGDKVASLIVRIGANDQAVQDALASVGQKARSLDADLKKLGNSPLAGGAQKSLESLRGTMKQITDAQERVAERGRLAAQGLEAMGGASRLTDSQLRSVNRTLQAGLESYRALGKEAPAELRRVASAVQDSVGGMSGPLSLVEKKAIALGTALGTALGSVALDVGRQLVAAGKHAFEYAESLTNLNAVTDISVEGLQRIEALGTTSGVSLETLAASVGMLQKNLDNPAAIKALSQMGLNYKEIRALKPEDQFLTIAQSISEIEDPVERMNAGTALFGRQWATIAPAIQGNIREIIAGVKTLSKEQIDALDEAGDAWDQFVKDSERGVTRFLGNLVLDAKKGEIALRDLLTPMIAIQKLQAGSRARANDPGFEESLKRITAPKLTIGAGPIAPGESIIEKSLKAQEDALEKAAAAAAKFKTVQDQLFGRAIIANAELLVSALGDDENLTRLTAAATKKLHDELGQALAVYQALGKDVPPKLQDLYDKTTRIANTEIKVKAVGGPSLAGLTKTFITYGETAKDGTLYTRDFSYELNAAQIQTDRLGNATKVTLVPTIKSAKIDIGEATEKTTAWTSSLETLSESFSHLAQVSDGRMGRIAQEIGTVVTALQLAGAAGKSMSTGIEEIGTKGKRGQGFANLAAGAMSAVAAIDAATSSTSKLQNVLGGAGAGAQAGAAFGPWGAAIGAGVGALVGIFRRNTEGRDAVRDFAKQFEGSFEGLHKQLSGLGAEGERLWISLTQGVGRNNPEQAKRAIAEVTAALDAQKRKFGELQAAIGTVDEKLSAITVLTPEIQAALDDALDETTADGMRDALARLNTELDKQATKYSELDRRLQEYGLSWDEVGNKTFKQEKLNQNAKDLRAAFDTLDNAQIDRNHIAEKMGANLNKFVEQAKKAGVEVPESMREVLQVAIDAGQLFDRSTQQIGKNGEALEANGEKWDDNKHKITDISQLGLTFGTTMETTMKTVEGAVDRLTLVLEGLAKFLGIELPQAAKDGAADVNAELDKIKDPVIQPTWEFPELPEFPTGGFPVPVPEGASTGARVTPFGLQHLQSGGFARHGSDTVPAMLTPGELVLTRAQQSNLEQALARPTVIENHFHGPVLAERDYIETHVSGGVLRGIERYHMPELARLMALLGVLS